MTTEQMDSTDDRRKRAAAQLPTILFGTPTEAEMAEALGRPGSRGVLVLPEVMRESLEDHIAEEREAYLEREREWLDRDDDAEDAPKDPGPDDTEADAAIALLRRAISAFPADWNVEGTRYVEFHKDITAEYARNAETLIVGLDDQFGNDTESDDRPDEATQAEEPIEDRLARAYKNGLEQGLGLGHRAFGRWDHS